MEQPVVQMPHHGVTARYQFEPLMPYQAHLSSGQFPVLQQQGGYQEQQQQRQHFHHQQPQSQVQSEQLQLSHPRGHQQYVLQSRVVPPQPVRLHSHQPLPFRGLHTYNSNPPPAHFELQTQNLLPFGSTNGDAHGQVHQLRRKTPSGTIDAGYDGSPAFLSAGLPPFKQLAVPASPQPFASPSAQQKNSYSGYIRQVVSTSDTKALVDLNNLLVNQAAQLRPEFSPADQLPNKNNTNTVRSFANQPAFASAHQPYLAPTAYNATSIDRRSLWPNNNFSQSVHVPQQQLPQPNSGTVGSVNNVNAESNSVDTLASKIGTSSRNLAFATQNIACDSAFNSAAPSIFAPPGVHNDGVHSSIVPSRQSTHNLSASIPQLHSSTSTLTCDVRTSGRANLDVVDVRQPGALTMLMQAVGVTLGSSSSSPSAAGSDIPQHVKEATIKLAESTYAKLVLHLFQTKKTFASRPLPNFTACAKPASAHQEQQKQVKQAQIQQPNSRAPLSNLGTFSTEGQRLASTQQQSDAPVSFLAGQNRNQSVVLQPNVHSVSSGPLMTDLNSSIHTPPVSLVQRAKDVLALLTAISEGSAWDWIEGMNLGACLHYALERFEEALEWFHRIFALQPNNVEVLSNIAATLYCMGRREEAVEHWQQAVRAKPSYFDSSEQLIGVLSKEQRHREIADIVAYVKIALRLPSAGGAAPTENDNIDWIAKKQAGSHLYHPDKRADASFSSISNAVGKVDSTTSLAKGGGTIFQDNSASDSAETGFGCCGYAVPGHETGRMLGLLHAGANSLYLMKDSAAASKFYEECVLIGVGHPIRSIQDLTNRIRIALSSETAQVSPRSHLSQTPSGPPLLPPEAAKLTARRTFPHTNGQLPGLRYVLNHQHKKAALTATSNALLSIAKISQDGMASNGKLAQGMNGLSPAVGDILSLYYLSMSIQESPSTANNVGILLANIQQSVALKSTSLQKQLQRTQHIQQLQQLQLAGIHQQHLSVRPNLQQGQLPLGGPTLSPLSIPSGFPPDSSLALAFYYYSYGLQLDPKHVHLYTNLGSLLKDAGHLDLAIKMYEQAVACDGNFDIALTNLANAVKDRGRSGEAIVYYRRAVTANPNFTEAVCGLSTALNSVCDWAGRGGAVLYGGRYDRWHVDEEGMLQDVRQYGRGSGLTLRVVEIVARQLEEASAWGRGLLHESAIATLSHQLKEAMGDSFNEDERGGSFDLTAELQKWAGQPWEGSRVIRLVERATRVVMHRFYRDRYILGTERPKGYPRPKPPASFTVPGAPTVLPFHTFTCPLTAKQVRLISQRNALRISCNTLRAPWLSSAVYPPPRPPQPHLNVGYISSDFNNHPLAHLMQSVFGFHDPTKAKAFCYATTPSDKSIYREKIERESPVFRDVTDWPPDRLIQQIVEDGIHILVNLNGYTRGAKNEIFAARPAPIQMAFMGFAGTLGAEWCDYLLSDSTAIPSSTLRPWRGNVSIGDVFRDELDAAADKWIYAENIIYSRDTFFCCDHKQSADVSERAVTWQEEKQRRWKMRKEMFPSLSDDAIILGNFNQLYKIDPTTFRGWLRILAGVPNAILWLLRFPDLGEPNIRKTAIKWAGTSVADRIFFTDVAPKALHINRARICDLFLDTPECNAHTTAADTLWSSTPLLTSPRYDYKMCSRIGASVLKGALPKDAIGQQAAADLIAEDDDQYEKMAIKLVSDMSYRQVDCDDGVGTYGEGSGRLADLRKILWNHKWECGLFDTRRWVSDLEDAYAEAWRKWVNGERGDIFLS